MSQHLHLRIPPHLASEPELHRIAHRPGLELVILRANLEAEHGGWVILRIDGEPEAIAGAIDRLEADGIEVERLEDDQPGRG